MNELWRCGKLAGPCSNVSPFDRAIAVGYLVSVAIYRFLNVFFFVFHSLIIVFNLTGWIWKKTRVPHLILVCSTAFSWFILGIWYGFGYCPCTDWHWQVREILGYSDPPLSYIQFLVSKVTSIRFAAGTIDTVVVILLIVPFVLSVVLFTRDLVLRRRSGRVKSDIETGNR